MPSGPGALLKGVAFSYLVTLGGTYDFRKAEGLCVCGHESGFCMTGGGNGLKNKRNW